MNDELNELLNDDESLWWNHDSLPSMPPLLHQEIVNSLPPQQPGDELLRGVTPTPFLIFGTSDNIETSAAAQYAISQSPFYHSSPPQSSHPTNTLPNLSSTAMPQAPPPPPPFSYTDTRYSFDADLDDKSVGYSASNPPQTNPPLNAPQFTIRSNFFAPDFLPNDCQQSMSVMGNDFITNNNNNFNYNYNYNYTPTQYVELDANGCVHDFDNFDQQMVTEKEPAPEEKETVNVNVKMEPNTSSSSSPLPSSTEPMEDKLDGFTPQKKTKRTKNKHKKTKSTKKMKKTKKIKTTEKTKEKKTITKTTTTTETTTTITTTRKQKRGRKRKFEEISADISEDDDIDNNNYGDYDDVANPPKKLKRGKPGDYVQSSMTKQEITARFEQYVTDGDCEISKEEDVTNNCFIDGCTKSYGTYCHLKRHVEEKHIGRVFVCNFARCSATFKQRSQAIEHVKNLHFGAAAKWKCIYCDQEYTRWGGVKRHFQLRRCKELKRNTKYDADEIEKIRRLAMSGNETLKNASRIC